MKVLVSAVACDPRGGSENFVGWQAVSALALDHDVWVVTSARHRESFEAVRKAGEIPPNVHVQYHGEFRPWHPNRLLARIQDWREFLRWSSTLLPFARELHRELQFDVSHHVTYSTWRVPSPLGHLEMPFVWGPVGGAGSMPRRFYSTLSPGGMTFEAVRSAAAMGRYSSSLKACARSAAHIFASCAQTQGILQKMRRSESGVSVLSPGFFFPKQFAKFPGDHTLSRDRGKLQLFAGGNIIGSKGCALALQALAIAKREGLQFCYTIAGGGPEEPYLRRLAGGLGLSEVQFIGPLRGEDYLRALREAHIFLLPSFRENIGLTMLEAMLSGAVPVVLNRSAPGESVTEECGFKIEVNTVQQVIQDFAAAILRLDQDRELLQRMSAAAMARVREKFSEAHYRSCVGRVYRELAATHQPSDRRAKVLPTP